MSENKNSVRFIVEILNEFLLIPVPPQKPTIFDGSGTELIGIAGPYNEGSSMSLTCVATGGKYIDF